MKNFDEVKSDNPTEDYLNDISLNKLLTGDPYDYTTKVLDLFGFVTVIDNGDVRFMVRSVLLTNGKVLNLDCPEGDDRISLDKDGTFIDGDELCNILITQEFGES